MNMNLAPDDCLEILRAADVARVWHSLDEERVCLRCGQTMKGRQIVILRDQLGHFLLHCATPACPATVDDWIYPTPSPSSDHREPATVVRTVEMDFSNW